MRDEITPILSQENCLKTRRKASDHHDLGNRPGRCVRPRMELYMEKRSKYCDKLLRLFYKWKMASLGDNHNLRFGDLLVKILG